MIQINLFCYQCQKKYYQLVDEKKPISIQCEFCNTDLVSICPVNGYVYILSNPCMPNLVKIGFTTRNIDERIAELNSSTGVPEPFILEAAFCSINPEVDEQIIHIELNNNRANRNREFFQIDPIAAIKNIENILKRSPDYTGKNGKAAEERDRLKEEERLVEIKRNALLSNGVFVEDPGNTIANYTFQCFACNKRFYSRYPQNSKTACPFCFSVKIK